MEILKDNGKAMKVTANEINDVFDKLLNNKVSREQISDWALTRQKAEDNGELFYEPSKAEKKIWKAIIYLLGIDLKDTPTTYLHDVDDILQFKNQLDL